MKTNGAASRGLIWLEFIPGLAWKRGSEKLQTPYSLINNLLILFLRNSDTPRIFVFVFQEMSMDSYICISIWNCETLENHDVYFLSCWSWILWSTVFFNFCVLTQNIWLPLQLEGLSVCRENCCSKGNEKNFSLISVDLIDWSWQFEWLSFHTSSGAENKGLLREHGLYLIRKNKYFLKCRLTNLGRKALN